MSAIKKCIIFGKATFLCFDHAVIIAKARGFLTQNTNHVEKVNVYINLLKKSLRLVVLI